MITRREFLSWTTTGLSAVSLRGAVPDLFARAAAASAAGGKSDHILVAVELAGGNDGLNTVIPFENDLYYQHRPTLGIPKKDALALADGLGLNPRMAALSQLFKDGRVAIVQGVGYPSPDRSHFRSMEIWHTASTDKRPPTTGWLGRLLDRTLTSGEDESLGGVVLTGTLPQAFHAEKAVVPVTAQIDALVAVGGDAERARFSRRLGATTNAADPTAAFLRRQADALYHTADRLRQATAQYRSTVEYPNGDLGAQLRRAAQIITGRLGTRVLFASQGGYDTHSYQADGHAALLEELSNALAAFHRDLRGQRVDDKVVVMVFSEFGRRVSENASLGTDHGAASCMVLVGSPVRGGLVGAYPSLSGLDDGDLAFTTDFRSVYATLLEGWLQCPAAPLLGGTFSVLDLLDRRA